MLYCPNFFWNVLQVWMTGKDVYLQITVITVSWPDKTWNILCSYCLQWNTSQSKFRNHYFLFLFAFSILSQLFLIWGCMIDMWFYHQEMNFACGLMCYLGGECLPPLGSILWLWWDRSAAAWQEIWPTCCEHPWRLTSSHCCQTEPAGLCNVSVEQREYT